MKSGPSGEEDANQQKMGSPGKLADVNHADDFEEPGFTDLDLRAGFSEIPPSVFHHHKLDSYL